MTQENTYTNLYTDLRKIKDLSLRSNNEKFLSKLFFMNKYSDTFSEETCNIFWNVSNNGHTSFEFVPTQFTMKHVNSFAKAGFLVLIILKEKDNTRILRYNKNHLPKLQYEDKPPKDLVNIQVYC